MLEGEIIPQLLTMHTVTEEQQALINDLFPRRNRFCQSAGSTLQTRYPGTSLTLHFKIATIQSAPGQEFQDSKTS
jgi:hypothetical protein